MLLQFLRDLTLSWRTKLGGNLRISDERPCAPARARRSADLDLGKPPYLAEGISGREKSGSERHSNDGNALAKLETAIGLRFGKRK